MAGLIKNIPTLDFGLQGNRGLGFPVLGHIVESLQSGPACELEKDQAEILIYTENNTPIILVCADVINEVRQPNIDCYLGSQEDATDQILQQEGFPIIVGCEE